MMRAATMIVIALAVFACRSEEDQTAVALEAAQSALAPFAAVAPYIQPGAPGGLPIMCMETYINGQYIINYCLTAGEFRTAAEALTAIEEAD